LTDQILSGVINPPQVLSAIALANGSGDRMRNRLVEIAMKALSHSPESRHEDVPTLQAELAAAQEGLATGAETPNKWKTLLARRH
jgi:hypothetical protein